jgi:hypothetical protein
MTNEQPKNIIININENCDKKNSEKCLNKEICSHFKQPFITTPQINPIRNFHFPEFLKDFKNFDFSMVNGPTIPKIIQNFNINNINISINPKSNISFQTKDSSKKENESLYKINYLNNYINPNIPYNNLIQPIIYNESNDLNKILENEKKELLNIQKAKIEFIESKQNKNPNIFNKFKVYRVEPKKDKEKLLYKLKHKRKYKPDDIRKKIKARFHKSIKNIVNENLKKAGSKYTFSFLPQIFISSISREKNHQILNLSYRDLIKKDFVSNIDEERYKNKKVDLAKYKNNLKVLEYLDKNPDICINSGFDIISKMKYGDLLEEYFHSDEFDRAIEKLREENEEEDYIKEYINKAKTYVKFFSEVSFKIKKKKENKSKNHNIAIEIEENEEKDENSKDKENSNLNINED